MRELFADCGEIEHVRLVRDKALLSVLSVLALFLESPNSHLQAVGVGKGFGFVLFKDVVSVRKALTFDKSDFGSVLVAFCSRNLP